MKSFQRFLLTLLAVGTCAQAQIVTIEGSVTSSAGVLASILPGTSIKETFEVGTLISSGVFPGILSYQYAARTRLESGGGGTIQDWMDTTFTVINGGTFFEIMAGSPEDTTILRSSSSSVLTSSFLALPVDVNAFDQTNIGNFNVLDSSSGTPRLIGDLFWKADSVGVNMATPVPEPGCYGILAGCLTLLGIILRSRKRRY